MKNRSILLITIPLLLSIIFCGNNTSTLFELNTKDSYKLTISPLVSGSARDGVDQYKEVGSLYQEEGDNQPRGNNQHQEEKNQPISIPEEPSSIQKISSISGVMAYETRGPIYVGSNSDFGPFGYNFTGDGTYGDPYLITGYEIMNNSHILIHIEHTTAYFKIDTNLLNGITKSYDGIFLNNVTHGTIFNNSISNTVAGINLLNSYNNTIYKNINANNMNGARISNSYNNTISTNTVYNSSYSGIYVPTGHFNVFTDNICFNNTWDGLAFSNVNNSIIKRNEVYDNGWEGIWFDLSYFNTITENLIYDNLLTGICLNVSSNQNVVHNNTFVGMGRNSVHIEDSNNNIITSNTMYGSSYGGIAVFSSSGYNLFEDNTIFNNTLSAIFITDNSHHNTADNNTLHSSHSGIYISNNANSNTLTRNTIFDSFFNGIHLQNSTNNDLADNDISENTGAGIYATSSSFNDITGNFLNSNADRGVLLFIAAYNNTIDNNTIMYNSGEGIKLDRSHNTTVSDNFIKNNYRHGVELWLSTYNTFDNNTISGNSWQGLYLPSSGNNSVTDSTIFDNGYNGIYIHSIYWAGQLWGPAWDNTILGNRIYQNYENGIAMVNASYNVIDDNDIYFNGNTSGCSPLGISDISFSIQQVRGGNGIFLDPSNHNNITGNRIFNNSDNGIWMEDSNFNLIEENNIYGNGINYGVSPLAISDLSFSIQQVRGGNGIFLDPSNNNSILRNTINYNAGDGIAVVNSSHNLIEDNDIYGNGVCNGGSLLAISDLSFSIQQVRGGNGIFLDPSDYNTIINNTIFNNSGDGIALVNSSHNLIEDNVIYGNGGSDGGSLLGISDLSFSIQQARGGNGIFLDPSDNNQIIHNVIHSNSLHGVLLIDSDETIIFGNTMHSNGFHGIYIGSSSINNEVERNDFVGNNIEGTSQAFDDGVENIFEYNYWDELTSPDEGGDGIVDEWYIIDGEAGNSDRNALTFPHNPETMLIHFISRPRIIFPNGGEEIKINEPLTVEWTKSFDSWDHAISFSVYYSDDNGGNWILLESEINALHYNWDITALKDGSNYMIRVVAICSEGLEVEDMSDATFTIGFPEPTTSAPVSSELTRKTTESKPPSVTSAPSLVLLFLSILSIVIITRVKNRKTR